MTTVAPEGHEHALEWPDLLRIGVVAVGAAAVWLRLWEPLRKVGRSETADLRSWPKPQVVFGYDGRDPVESDHYNACAMKYPFASNVYHDLLWYPTVGRARIRAFAATPWGRLFGRY